MYDQLFRRFLFPFYEERIAGRKTASYINEYMANLQKRRAELEAIQLAGLKQLLEHAQNNCSYYRETWKELGFEPGKLVSLDDLSQLPVLDKETIRENYDGFVAKTHSGKNILKATGGSSGSPFQFELDGVSNERRQAVMWRGYGAIGAGLGTKTLYVWGAHIAPVGKKTQIKDRLYHLFYNRKILNSFDMRDDNVGDYVHAHNQYRPRAVVGYVNPLVTMADYILENKLAVHAPEAILTGAEPLYEFQREKIERAFKAPVYNTYGCREFMLIGSECTERNGLHINIDHLVVELVDSDGQSAGVSHGDVVVTDLYNYGFPLIRYRNGDQASLGEATDCACGSPLPRLRSIDGRKLDVIRTPDGKAIPGEFFPHLLKDYPAVKQFQIVQETLDTVDLNVALNDGFAAQDLHEALALVEKHLGDTVNVQLHILREIPLTSSGKLRVAISKVQGE